MEQANPVVSDEPNLRPAFKSPDSMPHGPVIAPALMLADGHAITKGTFGLVCKLTPEIKGILDKIYGEHGDGRVSMALNILALVMTPGGSQRIVTKALVYWDPRNTTDLLNNNLMAGCRSQEDARRWKAGLTSLYRRGVDRSWIEAIMRRLAGEVVDPEPLFWTETGTHTDPIRSEVQRPQDAVQRLQHSQRGHQQQLQQRCKRQSTSAPSSPMSLARVETSSPLPRMKPVRPQTPVTPPTSSPRPMISKTQQRSAIQTYLPNVQAKTAILKAKRPTSTIPRAQKHPAIHSETRMSPNIPTIYLDPVIQAAKPWLAAKTAPDAQRIAAIKARQQDNRKAGLEAMRPTQRVHGQITHPDQMFGRQINQNDCKPKPQVRLLHQSLEFEDQVDQAGDAMSPKPVPTADQTYIVEYRVEPAGTVAIPKHQVLMTGTESTMWKQIDKAGQMLPTMPQVMVVAKETVNQNQGERVGVLVQAKNHVPIVQHTMIGDRYELGGKISPSKPQPLISYHNTVSQNRALHPQATQHIQAPQYTSAQMEEKRGETAEIIKKEMALPENIPKIVRYRASVEEEYQKNIESRSLNLQQAEQIRARRMHNLLGRMLGQARARLNAPVHDQQMGTRQMPCQSTKRKSENEEREEEAKKMKDCDLMAHII